MVDSVATPPLTATGEPRSVAPSLNCTLPVGENPVTVAVSVTLWPKVGADELTESAVLEAAWFTTCVKADDTLALLLGSPEYAAVMEWLPAASVLVEKAAEPLESVTAEPRLAEPSLNCTVPPGLLPVTVAVKVTFWPAVMVPVGDAVNAVLLLAN